MNPLHILPAHNCADTLPRILTRLPVDLTVVIDDGSLDGTSDVVTRLGFQCIRHRKNLGVGAALKTAIAYGLDLGFNYGITIDADGQHSVEKVRAIITALKKHDFVIGNRFHSINEIPDSKLASNLFASLLVNDLFCVKLYDVTCGLRGFKLGKDLVSIEDDSYGFLYRHLFKVLAHEKDIGVVDIECIYPYDQPLCTRRSELIGLIGAAAEVNKGGGKVGGLLGMLSKKIRGRKDLNFSIGETNFYAYYVQRVEAYIFQTHKRSVYDFHAKAR